MPDQQAAHAAGDPWNGRSASDALELYTTGINYYREHVKPTVRMHYHIEDGGQVVNVVPDYSKLWAGARAGGVTAMQILPGSANVIGGRGVTLKNMASTTYQGMKFPAAPHGLKMACGENPKRVYEEKGKLPSTRMGNVAGYRAQWIEAQRYILDWEEHEDKNYCPVRCRDPHDRADGRRVRR